MSITTPCYAIVHRPQWKSLVTRVSEIDFLILQALSSGNTLETSIEVGLKRDANFPIAASLQSWFDAGFFVGACCKD